MKQGYRRDGKGMAILRFFIGAILLTMLALLVYFAFSGDYSDKVTSGDLASASPAPTEGMGLLPSAETPAPTDVTSGAEDALSAATDTIVSVPTEAATAAPTAEPTAEPTPAVTLAPTPVPTAVPKEILAEAKTKGFSVPKSQGTLVCGITGSYLSSADQFGVLKLVGYSYVDDAARSGSDFATYIVVTSQEDSKKVVAYRTVSTVGASGVTHEAKIQSADAADFEVYLDVSGYGSGVYYVGIVTAYKNGSKTVYDYSDLGSGVWFTVNNGEVVKIKLPE